MDTILFVIQSAYTDGILRSVYPMKLQTNYSEFKKKRQFADVELFACDFTNGITEGFKPESLCSDVTNSPSELSMESPTEIVCQWFHLQKWIYHHLADSFLPYFSFFFPIPTLPSQTTNNQPQKKKSHFSQHKAYFFKFCSHSIRILIYYGFYHFL